MRKFVFITYWIGASIGIAFAQSIRNPYIEFIRPIIENEVGAAGDVWAYSGSGGYLFRFTLENTDGSRELFLASSLRANNLSAVWAVYRESAVDGFTPYGETVHLPMAELQIERTAQGISLWTWSSDQGQYHISKQTLINGNVITESYEVPYIQFVDSEEEKLMKRLASFVPQIEAIRLSDFLRDPNASWTAVDVKNIKSNEMGYVVIPELPLSKVDLQLTPEVALRELTVLQGPQASITPEKTESSPQQHPSLKSEASPTPTVAAESKSESGPLIILVAILALVVFLVRRKGP